MVSSQRSGVSYGNLGSRPMMFCIMQILLCIPSVTAAWCRPILLQAVIDCCVELMLILDSEVAQARRTRSRSPTTRGG